VVTELVEVSKPPLGFLVLLFVGVSMLLQAQQPQAQHPLKLAHIVSAFGMSART